MLPESNTLDICYHIVVSREVRSVTGSLAVVDFTSGPALDKLTQFNELQLKLIEPSLGVCSPAKKSL